MNLALDRDGLYALHTVSHRNTPAGTHICNIHEHSSIRIRRAHNSMRHAAVGAPHLHMEEEEIKKSPSVGRLVW